MCIATRTVRPVTELIRFVLGPDGQVVPDLTARLPGRGAWLTASRSALGEAIRRKAFARAFKGKLRSDPGRPAKKAPRGEPHAQVTSAQVTSAPLTSTDSTLPALAGLVEALMEKDALGALGLAKKAGRVVTGATKVAEAIRSGDVAILIHASDAAPDGVGKLDALARRVGEDTGREIALITILSGLQLDLALGRANVVHAALLAHPTSAGFLARIRRLERWRAD
nr:DUF448 domain-containing protein [Ancylobacter crimeensis]